MKYRLLSVLLLLIFSACVTKESNTNPTTIASPLPNASPINDTNNNTNKAENIKSNETIVTENSFTGSVESIDNKKKLIALIEKSENKEINLELNLSDAQMSAIYDLGQNKILVDLAYKETTEDPFPNAGYQLIIKIQGEPKAVFQDQNTETHKIKTKVKISEFAGPNQGIMSVTGNVIGN